MSISPSDRSEEVHPLMTIERCQMLDTDHRCISDKSVLLCHPPLYLPSPKSIPIPVTSPTLLHSSLSPLSHPLSLCSLFHWYPFSMPLWSSRLLHKLSPPPIPVFPCFTLVPLFLVPDQVKPTLQHRVSLIAVWIPFVTLWILTSLCPHFPLWLSPSRPSLTQHLWPNSDNLQPISTHNPWVKLGTQMFRKGATHKLKPSPSDITANGLSKSTNSLSNSTNGL